MTSTAVSITFSQLFRQMWLTTTRNVLGSLSCVAAILVLAVVFTFLRAKEYVSSMVVVPVETSMTDATSQLLSTSFSLRTSFQLGNLPPRISAFFAAIRSPHVARLLASDPRACDAIIGQYDTSLFGKAPEMPADINTRTEFIRRWLDNHVVVIQDFQLNSWTLTLRHKDPDAAAYLLGRLLQGGEEILRQTAIQQYSLQRTYVDHQILDTKDAQIRQTLYDVLGSVNRSLVVLRSGSNVATSVISAPTIPVRPSYPPALRTLGLCLLALSILAAVALAIASYLSLRRVVRNSSSYDGGAALTQLSNELE